MSVATMKPNIKKDIGNILLLLFLYTLQGIPLGLMAAVPMILQNRHVSYTEQAKFSFSTWPFSLKLLWAPIVDALYSRRMGRRKTWLIPMQYLIGIFMIILSSHVGELLDNAQVTILTAVFFALNFLAATQDIAVDGWALTMLRKENVGHSSTCNSVGQTTGFFLGYVVFLALESVDFCNQYLRVVPQETGVVTLPGFLYFWGWVFLVTTTTVWFMKRELPEKNYTKESIRSSYKCLWNILQLPNVQTLILFALTAKIGMASEAATGLKLLEAGLPKDRLALLAIPMTPLQIVLPLIISKYTTGPKPLNVFIVAIPFRLLFGMVFAWLVWITPSFMKADGTFPFHYFAMILIIYSFHQVALYAMFVAVMAFFAKVSDPVVGGTYMTLLNTVTNLGSNWPSTLALWLLDPLTTKTCLGFTDNDCSTAQLEEGCKTSGGKCEIVTDGYYIEAVACVIFGCLWLVLWGKRTILRLQDAPLHSWNLAGTKRRNINSHKD